MGWLKQLWRGQYPLWKAFWVFNVLFILLFIIALDRTICVDSLDTHTKAGMLLLLQFVRIPYSIVAVVGLKRSTDNYMGHAFWKNLSYLILIFIGIYMYFSFLLAFQ